jgi:hypothetical protein
VLRGEARLRIRCRRKRTGEMLESREMIDARVLHRQHITLSIWRGMDQRPRARPVFVGSVGVENLRQHLVRLRSIQQPRPFVGHRLLLRRVREGEQIVVKTAPCSAAHRGTVVQSDD